MRKLAPLFTVLTLLCGMIQLKAESREKLHTKVEVTDYSEKAIYHSPERVGYTSWVGLWRTLDGRIQCSFEQRTAAKGKSGSDYVSSFPVLESHDDGATWARVPGDVPAGGGRGMAILKDGTMVRPHWASEASDAGYVQRSTDGGRTWEGPVYFMSAKEFRAWPTIIRQLRDGRLVLMAGVWKRGDGDVPNKRMTKMIFISSDKGKSWSKPIILMPTEVGVCEESDFCELPNGDLFWIHRVEHFPDKAIEIPPLAARMGPNPPESYWYSDRMQSITRKKGNTFVPGPAALAPFRHSGFPAVVYTREGLILHLATDGTYWTFDVGKTWTKLDIPGTKYYPQALQLPDGKIVCIGHIGGDDVYGTVNQAVFQQTFRLSVAK